MLCSIGASKDKGGGVDVSRALVKIKSGRAEVCPASEVLPAKGARSSGSPAEAGGSQSDEWEDWSLVSESDVEDVAA